MNARRYIPVVLVGVVMGLSAPVEMHARALLVIGSEDQLWPAASDLQRETRTWIDVGARQLEATHPQERGFVLVDTSGIYIAPFFLEPDVNLSPGYMERGGWERTRIGERDKQFFRALDGDIDTFYFFAGGRDDHANPTVDLGGIFPVNRILFYTHPDRVEQYTDYFILYVNDGDPAKIDSRGNPIWEEVRRETENKNPVMEILFPTQPVRYASILPQSLYSQGVRIRPKPWEIAEFEIYGEGYVPASTYISEIIDIAGVVPEFPGEQASWGQLHWIGHRDADARVVIRTRTGYDEDPNVYWWNTGRGDELSTLKVDGTPLKLNDYLKVPNTQRGPVTYDTEHWSFWSPPYDFDQGVAGAPIASPGPRRYIQLRVDFYSTVTDGSRLESIGFDFSKPPSARSAIAEVFPREVRAGVDTTFTYFVRPTLSAADRGFDSLEIETFVAPSQVRSVRIEGEEVDLQAYPPELLSDRLVVHFPHLSAPDTQKLVEVEFAVPVVRYGTEFQGRIFERDSDEVRQLVDGGDATNRYSGGGIAVTIPFGRRLISSVEVSPNPFTPNGDGVNDRVQIAYALLNLTEMAEMRLVIYDLAGRRVRELQREQLLSGTYAWHWDGQAEGGGPVPPGTYLYRVSVQTDERHERHTGILNLAY